MAACVVAGVASIFGLGAAAFGQGACPPSANDWQLIFEDNFDGPTINTSKWRIEDAYINKNNELQYYAPDEAFIDTGKLVLRSRQRVYGGRNYTSGLVDTLGKFSIRYGRIEARMKLPRGQGIWPAFWMLPADGAWPPEIDIMENLGHQPGTIYMTHHFGIYPDNNSSGGSFAGPDYSAAFHDFAVEWTPGRVEWFIDGVSRFTSTINTPDRPMYIILNTAVGGDWPGNPNGTTVFPQRFEIEWVRAYTRGNFPPEPAALRNSGFEEASAIANPTAPISAWTTFGNASRNQGNALVQQYAAKVFGNFTGSLNFSGLTQSLPALPGQVWTGAARARHITGDLLATGNTALVRLEWLDAVGLVIGTNEVTTLTSTTPANVWQSPTVTATAPAGAARARLGLLVRQPAMGAGAAYFDQASLTLVSGPPVCRADFDGNGTRTVNDLFVFLAQYFGNCYKADYNLDGTRSVQDIFDFLEGYFGAC